MNEHDTDTRHDSTRLVLFDGVCNLCNASVSFIIDRDHKKRFRYAALQSNAAKMALVRASAEEDLPDSVVLIDSDGVHTRSDAALRIARHLGFPWMLLAALLVIPRFIRDPMYAWIARNRYAWFGRQDTCRVATPEERGLFLDSGETIDPVAQDEARTPSNQARGLGLGTLPKRFMLVYPIVFMIPFPLTLLGYLFYIPGLSNSVLAGPITWVLGLHAKATQPVIGWLGRTLTGETPSFAMTGSGDGTASYLGALLNLVIAVVIVLVWWFWKRGTPVSNKFSDVARVLLRYYLAWMMLSYGFAKVFPLQFSAMGPDRMLQTYGDSSPMGLLWTFMGASPGYQMFAGGAEVLCGLLLLFRRTTLLGALIMAAVMTNVFAMNMFYDVPVKLNSFHYLLFSVFLILPDAPRLFGLFVANVPVAPCQTRAPWSGSRGAGLVLCVSKLVLILALLASNISSGVTGMRTRGLWAPEHDMRGVYRVESFEIGGEGTAVNSSLPDASRWVRVGMNPPWVATVVYADGSSRRVRLEINDDASTLTIHERLQGQRPSEPFTFEELGEGRVRLLGTRDGAPMSVTLTRVEPGSVFETRTFRWINEYPYNR